MDMNDILKSIGQKQLQEKKKSAPRIQMIHYTKLKPSPDNFYAQKELKNLPQQSESQEKLRIRCVFEKQI